MISHWLPCVIGNLNRKIYKHTNMYVQLKLGIKPIQSYYVTDAGHKYFFSPSKEVNNKEHEYCVVYTLAAWGAMTNMSAITLLLFNYYNQHSLLKPRIITLYSKEQLLLYNNQQLIGDYTTHSWNISGLHSFLIFLNTHNI